MIGRHVARSRPSPVRRVAAATLAAIGAGLVWSSPAKGQVANTVALRAAFDNLNGNGPAAEIQLLPGVTYVLPGGATCSDEDGNLAGDLDIRRSQPLRIFTPDAQAPAILLMTCDPATSPQRLIDVLPPTGSSATGTLTLRNVIIRNGQAPAGQSGGGVRSTGDVVLQRVVFENNAAGRGADGEESSISGKSGGSGGAVSADGSVIIETGTFRLNRAGDGGNGIASTSSASLSGAPGGAGGAGGAVFARAGLTIESALFIGNRGGHGGNGGNGLASSESDPSVGGAGGSGGHGERGRPAVWRDRWSGLHGLAYRSTKHVYREPHGRWW